MIFESQDTIVSVAKKRANNHPERNYVTFLQDGDGRELFLSYQELNHAARKVAGWLQNHGLEKGDRALIMLPNGIEFTQIFYGCLYAGVVAVPQPQQLQAYLKTFLPTMECARPKLLIATPSIIDLVKNKLPPTLEESFSRMTVISASEILGQPPSQFEEPVIEPADIAYLQFTSGSTGEPKGVMVGHGNIVDNMEQARIFGNWEEGKGTSLWLPLFHDFGLAAGMLGAMYNGGFVILMTPAQFMVKPFRWLNSISKYGCAYSYSPPFGFDLCIRRITDQEKKDLDLSSAVSMVYGAEPVHYTAVKRFNQHFAACGLKPTVVRPGFGMAETVIMFSESAGLSALCADRRQLETQRKLKLIDESAPREQKKYLVNLGTAMRGHEMVIKDEYNNPLPEGEVGEITLSGPSVCLGYYQNPEATLQNFKVEIKGKKGSFLITGDLGLIWQGNLYFTGRVKDIIIIRGRNYFPQDIEFAVPQGKEIRPGCVLAYAAAREEEAEQLILAMEIEAELLRDKEMLLKYVLPAIDQKIVNEIGQQFQIYPEQRLYLRPSTLIRTSSGKIKHQETTTILAQDDFKGLIARFPEISADEKAVMEVKITLTQLFQKLVGQKPQLEKPLNQLFDEPGKLQSFFAAIQENYAMPGLDIKDFVDETTTMEELADWLEDQVLSGMIPI